MEYFSTIKKEILPLWQQRIDFEGIMLREISQRQILYDFNYMWNLKKFDSQIQRTDGGGWMKKMCDQKGKKFQL